MADTEAPLDRLTARLMADFGGRYMIVDQEITLTQKVIDGEQLPDKTAKFAIIVNVKDGIKHYALLVPDLGPEWKYYADIGIKKFSDEIEGGVKVWWGHKDDFGPDADSLDSIPFSGRVYVYTDHLLVPKSEVISSLKLRRMKAIVIDDEKWEKTMANKKPDVFISHDARDKDAFVRELYKELIRRQLKVWFDEVSLKVGDQLSASIDKGLTECGHAVLVISPHLLENEGWASREVSTLLSRAVAQPDKNLILPIWLDVSAQQVRERSAMLADLVAIPAADGAAKVADKILAAVRS